MLIDDLLELQRIDTTTDQLQHRRANTPERASAAAADGALGTLRSRRAQIDARRVELESAVDALEHEGHDLTAHRTRLQAQLKTVIAPREAEALMHELDILSAKRDEMDDRELALLEEQGELEGESGSLSEREPALVAATEAAHRELSATEATIDGEIADLQGGRTGVVGRLDASLIGRYERLRARMGGVAVARLEGTHCSGCHLDLSTAEVNEVRATTGDLADCPQCGRLIVP